MIKLPMEVITAINQFVRDINSMYKDMYKYHSRDGILHELIIPKIAELVNRLDDILIPVNGFNFNILTSKRYDDNYDLIYLLKIDEEWGPTRLVDIKLKYSDTPNIDNMVVHKYALYAYDPGNHKINNLIYDRPLKKKV